jgi:hypothetical protein
MMPSYGNTPPMYPNQAESMDSWVIVALVVGMGLNCFWVWQRLRAPGPLAGKVWLGIYLALCVVLIATETTGK